MADDFTTKEACREKHAAATKEQNSACAQLKEHSRKLQEADVRFAELSGDVKHIKDRIDNGLSRTITQIKEKMDEFIPLVRESSEWANRFKQAVYFVAVIAFGGGLVSLALHFAAIIAARVLR